MDNLEQGAPAPATDPSGEADVTASQGQSGTEETQTAESTEAFVDGETAEETAETTHPWEADERFKGKTPEEMYKIVAEADKYKGVLSQKAKIADMLSAEVGLTPEKLAEAIAQRQQAQQQQFMQDNPLAAVQQELNAVKQQLIIKEEDAKLEKFLQDKPEYSDFKDDIRKLGFSVERDKDWAEIADKYFGRAIVRGQENAYKKIETKTRTQASGVSRSEPRTSFTADELRSMSAAELEKILPHKALD